MPNVALWIWNHASARPDAHAVAGPGPGNSLTFRQLRDRVAEFAARLTESGIVAGDRVLLVAPSVPEFAVAYYGLQAVGAIAVTVNTMSTERELEYFIDDSGCSLVIAWHESSTSARAAARKRDVAFWVLTSNTQDPPAAAIEPCAMNEDDTAVIIYTSGTTGRPKGAQLTIGNLDACATAFGEVLRVGPEDRFGTALPLFHVFGQAAIMATAMRAGASLSLLPRFDALELMNLVLTDRLTALAGVPTMWNAMLHAEGDFDPQHFKSLRVACSGGASLPAEVIRAFSERFGCVILEGYGLSESTGAATFNGLDRPRKAGYVGVALPGTQIAVRDSSGQDVAPGIVGEIFMKGPVVMKGYWGRDEATRETLTNGWLRTGDLGSMDADGDVRIVDRAKDLIIRGGYNVYPREVEEVLYEHPDVIEVAVVGVPDPHYGEEIAAVLALRDGAQLDIEKFRAWAKEQLSAYKVPRLFHVVDELPKGPTGKILKRAIDRDAVRTASATRN